VCVLPQPTAKPTGTRTSLDARMRAMLESTDFTATCLISTLEDTSSAPTLTGTSSKQQAASRKHAQQRAVPTPQSIRDGGGGKKDHVCVWRGGGWGGWERGRRGQAASVCEAVCAWQCVRGSVC
jgi:hypothetical protein